MIKNVLQRRIRSFTQALPLLFGAFLSTAAMADYDLEVIKTGPAQSTAGQNVTYTYTLTNYGPDNADTVRIEDRYPAGLTYVSFSAAGAPGFTCTDPTLPNGVVSCTKASMAPGAVTFVITFNVPQQTAPGTIFTNVAETFPQPRIVDGNPIQPDRNDENNTSSATTIVAGQASADLGVNKQGPSVAGADTNVTYTITLTNSGPAAATNITLTDALPGNLEFVSLLQAGTALTCVTPTVGTNGTITCTLPSYPNGASTTLTLSGHIPANATVGTSYANSATIQSDSDPNQENNASQTQFTVTGIADVRAGKSGPATVTTGASVVYTLTIANDGPSAAQNARLYDRVPANATFVSYTQLTGPGAVCSGNAGLDCTILSLPSGASATFSLTLQAGTSGAIANTVITSSDTYDPNGNNNQASVTTTITPSVDVSVNKNGPAGVIAGGNIAYTITVANAGPSPAANVSLTDSFPGNTSFVSLAQNTGPTFACGNTQTTANCTIASLASGAQATFTLTLKVLSSAPTGALQNTATVTTATADTNPNNDTASSTATVSANADVSILKTGPQNVTAGQAATYAITVTNSGPSDSAQVTFNDTLPTGTTFASYTQNTGPAFTCTLPPAGQGGTLSCSRAPLAAGATATFTVVLNVASDAIGTVSNTATLVVVTPDSNPNNNTSTAAANVVTSSDLAVNMTGPATVVAGATATYAITVVNNGPSNASTVSLTDALPAGTTFASLVQGTGPVFTCANPGAGNAGTVTCTIATLAPATPATFTLVANVGAAAVSPISNTATVLSTTADATPGNNSSTVTTTVVRADVSVVKTAPAGATPGSTIAYTITVANAGPAAAATVALTDTLPANTTFASLTQDSGPVFGCTSPAAGATGTVTCNIATLANGASAAFTLTLNIAGGAVGTLSNTAAVSAATPDANNVNNTSTATATLGASADLSVAKTGPATVTPGQNATYIVVISNAGPSSAANATMTDGLPANTTFVSATQKSGPAFTCTTPAVNANGTVTCTIASLANGAAATFEIVVKIDPNATQPISNTATVSSTTPDPRPGNASAAAAAAIALAQTDISVDKTAVFNALANPKTIAWTITVRNLGPGVANNVIVTDTLQPGLTLNSVTPSQGTCVGAVTIICSLGVLAVNATATITLNTTLASNQTTAINTASATTDNPDTNAANNAGTAYAQFTAALIPTMSWSGLIAMMIALLAIGGWTAGRRRRA